MLLRAVHPADRRLAAPATRSTSLLVVGLMLGIAGASFAVVLPLASRWYPPERQGLVMGIAAAGNSGTVVANLVAPRARRASSAGTTCSGSR